MKIPFAILLPVAAFPVPASASDASPSRVKQGG